MLHIWKAQTYPPRANVHHLSCQPCQPPLLGNDQVAGQMLFDKVFLKKPS